MAELKPSLTTFDLTMIAVGGTIGSGIFLTPSLVARNLEAPLLILAVWVAGGCVAMAGSLTFAELAALMPGAGGVYVYLSRTYGKLFGFLYGWAYLLVVNTGGLAALGIAFATYLGFFVPLNGTEIKVVAVAGLIFLTLINVLGVKVGGIFSDVFTVLKLIGIGSLILTGFALGSGRTTDFSSWQPPGDWLFTGPLAAAMVGVLWSYGGWQHASYAAGEAKEPRRSVPLAMIAGAAVVTVTYIAVNTAYLFLLPPPAIAGSSRVAADAMAAALGPPGAGVIALAIFVSTFGTAGIYTLTAPRIYYAMARDGIFFAGVARVHPRFRTPAHAIVLQACWAVILVLFWGTFENLISYVVFTDWIFFGLAGSSVFLLRRRLPERHRPYRAAGYPLTPLLFVVFSLWFVLNTLWEKPEQAVAGLLFLALGVPVYYVWKRRPLTSSTAGV